ncbi:MAG: Hsp20/alpha crystallin family protein [Chthoniobacterales bacterium]
MASSVFAEDTQFTFNPAIKMTESAEDYTISITLPEKNPPKFDLKMEGQTLTLSTEKSAQEIGYQQSFTLPKADRFKTADAQRKGNQFIVTVPKADAATLAAQAQQTPPPSAPVPTQQALQPPQAQPPQQTLQQMPSLSVNLGAGGNQALANMARMQQQMGQVMQQMMQGFDDDDDNFFGKAMSGNSLNATPVQSSRGSISLQDNADNYTVLISVSQEEAKNINVSVDHNRILKITMKGETSSQTPGIQSYQSSNSTQIMLLPGAVRGDKITKQYKDGSLQVTLPKS